MNKKDLTITAAMATGLLAVVACDGSGRDDWNGDVYADRDTAVCVDANGLRVDDDLCSTQSAYQGGYHGGGGGSNAFLWYYLGRNSALPYYGESIRDPRFAGRGTYQAQPGASYVRAPVDTRMSRSQAVSRGGLGSSGFRFGSSRS